MVVNHIDKTFVTSDAATILKEVPTLPLSSKCNIPQPKCWFSPVKCKKKNVEMLPTSLSPSLDSFSVTLKTSSKWVYIPARSSMAMRKPPKKPSLYSIKIS
jgi:hypothetical protein